MLDVQGRGHTFTRIWWPTPVTAFSVQAYVRGDSRKGSTSKLGGNRCDSSGVLCTPIFITQTFIQQSVWESPQEIIYLTEFPDVLKYCSIKQFTSVVLCALWDWDVQGILTTQGAVLILHRPDLRYRLKLFNRRWFYNNLRRFQTQL